MFRILILIYDTAVYNSRILILNIQLFITQTIIKLRFKILLPVGLVSLENPVLVSNKYHLYF